MFCGSNPNCTLWKQTCRGKGRRWNRTLILIKQLIWLWKQPISPVLTSSKNKLVLVQLSQQCALSEEEEKKKTLLKKLVHLGVQQLVTGAQTILPYSSLLGVQNSTIRIYCILPPHGYILLLKVTYMQSLGVKQVTKVCLWGHCLSDKFLYP